MKEFVFSSALGLNLSPFATSKKESATAAAIIGGVGLAGSLYSQYKSLESQADANKTNMQINREQLAAQRYLYDQQRADERFLVNQAYERDLPKNQVKNLREAGINPAFAMENGSFGVQQAQAGSAPSAPSVGSPHAVQPLNYEGMGIAFQNAANFAASQIQTDKENERADKALKSDSEYKSISALSSFMNSLTEAKKAGVNEKFINSQIQDLERNYLLNVKKADEESKYRAQEIKVLERTNEIRQYEAETSRMAAKAGIALNGAQISKVAQEISESKERVFQMAQNGASQRSIDAFVERQQKATAERLERENERGKRQESTKRRQAYMDFTDWLFTPLKGIVSVGIK